jgi:hypothetical protein
MVPLLELNHQPRSNGLQDGSAYGPLYALQDAYAVTMPQPLLRLYAVEQFRFLTAR